MIRRRSIQAPAIAAAILLGVATAASAQTTEQAPPRQGMMGQQGVTGQQGMPMMQPGMGGGMMGGMHGPGMQQGGPGMGMGMGMGMGQMPMMGGMGHQGGMMPCPMMSGAMGPQQGMMPMGHMGQMGQMGQTGPMRGHGVGPGTIYGAPYLAGAELTVEQAKALVERRLAWHGNPRLKIGAANAREGGDVLVEIVTQDGSLVQKLAVDRRSGGIRQAE